MDQNIVSEIKNLGELQTGPSIFPVIKILVISKMGQNIVSEIVFFLQGKQTTPVTVHYCRTILIVRLPRNLTSFRISSSFTRGLSWLLRGSVQQNSLPDQMPGATTDHGQRKAGDIFSLFQMFCRRARDLQIGRELGKAIVGLFHYRGHNPPSSRVSYTCSC